MTEPFKIAYVLTDAQREYIGHTLAQMKEVERQFRDLEGTRVSFLNYVVNEAKLPKTESGYTLSDDGTALVVVASVTEKSCSDSPQ
jgi:hypothetical protein